MVTRPTIFDIHATQLTGWAGVQAGAQRAGCCRLGPWLGSLVCRCRVSQWELLVGRPRNPLGVVCRACLSLHELPSVPVLHQNQRCLWLHEGHLRLQRAGAAPLADLHCGPAHQEVPNSVPGGWRLAWGWELGTGGQGKGKG